MMGIKELSTHLSRILNINRGLDQFITAMRDPSCTKLICCPVCGNDVLSCRDYQDIYELAYVVRTVICGTCHTSMTLEYRVAVITEMQTNHRSGTVLYDIQNNQINHCYKKDTQ